MFKKMIISTLALSIFASQISFAQEVEINELIDEAMNKNPYVLEATIDYEKSNIDLSSLRSKLKKEKNDDDKDNSAIERYQIQLKYDEILVNLIYEEVIKEEKKKIKSKYYDYEYYKKLEEIQKTSYERAISIKNEFQKRYEMGDISSLEYQEKMLDFKRKELDYEKSKDQRDSSLYDLNIYLGRFLDEGLESYAPINFEELDINSLNKDDILDKLEEVDTSYIQAQKTYELSNHDYQENKSTYTDINTQTKIYKTEYEKNNLKLELQLKEMEKTLIDSIEELKNLKQDLDISSINLELSNKNYENMKLKYELKDISLGELNDSFLEYENVLLSHQKKIRDYEIKTMEFKNNYIYQ